MYVQALLVPAHVVNARMPISATGWRESRPCASEERQQRLRRTGSGVESWGLTHREASWGLPTIIQFGSERAAFRSAAGTLRTFDENPSNCRPLAVASYVQGSTPIFINRIHSGTPLEQELHDFFKAILRGLH